MVVVHSHTEITEITEKAGGVYDLSGRRVAKPAKKGVYVKDGKKAYGVSLVTVAANYLELMKDVVAVGSDLEWSYMPIACPSVMFKGAAVSGE